jgi:hypothetical protein
MKRCHGSMRLSMAHSDEPLIALGFLVMSLLTPRIFHFEGGSTFTILSSTAGISSYWDELLSIPRILFQYQASISSGIVARDALTIVAVYTASSLSMIWTTLQLSLLPVTSTYFVYAPLAERMVAIMTGFQSCLGTTQELEIRQFKQTKRIYLRALRQLWWPFGFLTKVMYFKSSIFTISLSVGCLV